MLKTTIHTFAITGCLLLFGTGCGSLPKDVVETPRLQQPPPGKALVNFLRPSKAGGVRQAIFDVSGKMLCDLPPACEFQYVCEPGDQVFFAWAEKVTAVKVTAAAGKTYDVMVDWSMGWVKHDLKLTGLTKSDPRRPQLADFERRCRVVSQTRTAHIEDYETKNAARISEIKRDFLGGQKQERLQVLGPDDCR